MNSAHGQFSIGRRNIYNNKKKEKIGIRIRKERQTDPVHHDTATNRYDRIRRVITRFFFPRSRTITIICCGTCNNKFRISNNHYSTRIVDRNNTTNNNTNKTRRKDKKRNREKGNQDGNGNERSTRTDQNQQQQHHDGTYKNTKHSITTRMTSCICTVV